MPTSVRKRYQPGDIIVHKLHGHFIDKGDRVRVVRDEGRYIRVFALKWEVAGAPLGYTQGMLLDADAFYVRACMFDEGGGVT